MIDEGGTRTSRTWEESGWPQGEVSTDRVVETGEETLCEDFDPPARKPELECVFLSVVSHEADPGQALVCGTDLVDVEKVDSCALDPDQGPSLLGVVSTLSILRSSWHLPHQVATTLDRQLARTHHSAAFACVSFSVGQRGKGTWVFIQSHFLTRDTSSSRCGRRDDSSRLVEGGCGETPRKTVEVQKPQKLFAWANACRYLPMFAWHGEPRWRIICATERATSYKWKKREGEGETSGSHTCR